MAIEIKELIVRFSVEDEKRTNQNAENSTVVSKKQIKEIIKTCTEEVLNKISQKQDR